MLEFVVTPGPQAFIFDASEAKEVQQKMLLGGGGYYM
jgi:hypothetical protein